MIGQHVVMMGATDLSCFIDSVTIQHGRDDPGDQPEASSATFELSWDTEIERLPAGVEIGKTLTVTTQPPGGPVSTRFVGRITDLDLEWDDAGELTPDRPLGQIIAVGSLADYGRRVIGAAPWVQQLDGARVAAIVAASGLAVPALNIDPGTVQILGADIDSQPALDLMSEVAESAVGVVWQDKAGALHYADAVHRKNTPVRLTLDACDVLVSPAWKRTLAGLVNKISLGYGPTPDEGEQPRYLTSDAASIAAYGTYDYSVATVLADLSAAQTLGNLLMVRNSKPSWLFSELPVDMAGLDLDRTNTLLSLDVHALLYLTGLPVIGQAPTSTWLWLEGWSEVLTYGSHELTLSVSSYCRTAVPPQWDETDPAWTWDTMGNRTWDDLACLPPIVPHGRWNDVPASTRWDTVDPAVTWDTWEG